jgi:tricorn protease
VEMSPAAVIAGHDPQLEKEVEVLMAELKKNPPVRAKRPAYPNKWCRDPIGRHGCDV